MTANIYPEDQWGLERLGKFTSSEIFRLLTDPKSKEAKERGELSSGAKTYVYETIAEILTGTVRQVSNLPMLEWGNLYEPDAVSLLAKTFPKLEYFGNENKKFFLLRRFSGGSPDAVEFESRTVFEVKCPENPAVHVEYLLLNELSLKETCKDYWAQLQMNMMCLAKEIGCGFRDMQGVFASYCPLMQEEENKLKLITVMPDLELEMKINSSLDRAESFMTEIIGKLA